MLNREPTNPKHDMINHMSKTFESLIAAWSAHYVSGNKIRSSFLKILQNYVQKLIPSPQSDEDYENNQTICTLILSTASLCLADIRREYETSVIPLSPERSRLYRMINSGLATIYNNKQLSQIELVIFIGKLHLIVRNNDNAQRDLIDTVWPTKDVYLACIESNLIHLLRSSGAVQTLKKTPPSAEKLARSMNVIPQAYLKTVSKRFFNSSAEHRQIVEFIMFIRKTVPQHFTHEELAEHFSADYKNLIISRFNQTYPDTSVDENEILYLWTNIVRRGIYLFALLEVSKNYAVLNADGYIFKSDLYKKILEALALGSLKEMTCPEKVACLMALRDHMTYLSLPAAHAKYVADQDFKLSHFNEFNKKLEHWLSHRDQIHNPPGIVRRVVTTAASTATNYTASAALGMVVTNAVTATAFGGATITALAIASPLAPVIVGAVGSVALAQLAVIALPTIGSTLLDYLAGLVSGKAAEATDNFIRHLGENTKEAHKLAPLVSDEGIQLANLFLTTVLYLPDRVVSADDKKAICEATGYVPSERWHPHTNLQSAFGKGAPTHFVPPPSVPVLSAAAAAEPDRDLSRPGYYAAGGPQ